MGRIKSLMIKKAAKQLIIADSARFTDKFEDNKKSLGRGNLPSKSTRNKVAGYMARLQRAKKEVKVPKAKKIEEVPYRDYN